MGLLKARLRELGITAGTPTEFIEKAKGDIITNLYHQTASEQI